MTPLYHEPNTLNGTNTSKKHYNPYQRSTRNRQQQHPLQQDLNLHQVELGIVDGSSFKNRSANNNSNTPSDHPVADPSQRTGLLNKCVDWLFKMPSKSKKKTDPNNIPPPTTSASNSLTLQHVKPAAQVTHIDFKQPPHTHRAADPPQPIGRHPSITLNHSNFNSLPAAQNRSRSIHQPLLLRSQSPFVPTYPPILDSSSSSSSLRSANNNNNGPSSSQKTEPRRPSTSHATLNIPLSSADPHSIFNPQLNRPIYSKYQPSIHASVRSLSPLSRRTDFSPSVQIVPSSSFSSLGRLVSPRRTLNSTIGLPSAQVHPTPQTIQSNSIGQKREYDEMSISPIRPHRSPQSRSQSCSLFPNDSQATKKQMFYDPELGFVTRELREKILREKEMKLRQEQGRPFPTNEAEKILQMLELNPGSSSNPFLKTSRHLPSISVPAPSSKSAHKMSLMKNMNGSNGLSTSLDAIYEEQALHSNPTIIAPITKKLNADRLKRLADRKGNLRVELKKRKMVQETIQKRDFQNSDHPLELNGSTSSNQPTIDPVAQRPTHRRSASVDTTSELASPPPRRRSSRKIGKLTSDSSKAKVNQGRKSRSQSVNEEEAHESHQDQMTTLSSSRLTRGSAKRASALNGSNDPAKSSQLNSSEPNGAVGKAFKSLKSPSPIQEEDEDLANQSVLHRAQIPAPQHTTCLHPTVRSSSISLQTPTSLVKSASTFSLRPGRTFSSRRHAKARVFSALEEDLPPLNDEDDDEADSANEKLKKIKLPSTFLSSFKLDKFTPPPPPQADAQPAVETQEAQDLSATSGLPKKSVPHSSEKISLFGQFATSNTTSAPTATPTTREPTINSIPPSSSKGENQVESANPPGASSTFFSLANGSPVQSENQSSAQQPMASLGVFSRIPSDKPPPNFFSGITTSATTSTSTTTATEPKSSDASISQPEQNKSDQQTQKNPTSSLFSFQPANSSAATSSPGLFKFGAESNNVVPKSSAVDTPNVVTESTETSQSKPSLFSFATPTSSSQSTTTTGGDNSVLTSKPIFPAVASTNESTKLSNPPPPPTVPAFTFGGGSNLPASIFGSQPAPTNTGSDQMKADSVPSVPSVTAAPFSSSTFAFGSSQPSSTNNQITNTQSSSSSQSGMFGMMNSTTQPTPSFFGNSSTTIPAANPISSASTGFNFNVSTKPTTETPFGAASSSQQTPSSFVFGATTPSTSNVAVPTAVSSGLFGGSSPAVANGAGVSSAPPISFTFGNPSSSSNNTSSSPFVFGANSSPGLTSTPTASFGQTASNNANSATSAFTFGAGNPSSSTSTTQNQNQASSGMFGFNNQPLSQSSVEAAPSSSSSRTAFNFGGSSQGFNANMNGSTTSTSLFGNSSTGGVQPSTTNLFGGLNGTTNKNGVFGGGSSLFGAPSTTGSVNNSNSSNSMMETNPISNPMFGGGMNTNNGGGMVGFNNNNSSTSGFSPFGTTNSNPPPPSINFGGFNSSINPSPGISGNPDPNLVNPQPPATPGGFVFNIGSSTSTPGRTIKKLPGARKVKR